MKKILILLSLFSMTVNAEVQIHTDGFSNVPAGSGSHYSGSVMQWSVWEAMSEHDQFGLPYDYIAAATKESGDPNLSENDFELPGQTTTAMNLLKRYYTNRAVETPTVQVQAEAVFTSKIQVDLPNGTDVSEMNSSLFAESFINSDAPHAYTEVSKDWVHGFLPNYHLAKENLDDSSIYYLVTINAGEETYNCPTLNFALKMNEDALLDRRKSAYIFLLVKFDEVSSHSLVEVGASKIFTQEIIYSTSFLRAGKNIISLYPDKIISQNAIVVTDQVMSKPELIVNRLDLNGLQQAVAAAQLLGAADDQLVLTNDNVTLVSPDGGTCGLGLGLGVASYTYNIANMLIEGL